MNRRYGQFCGVAWALDLVGERWTLLIVRDLLMGPMRYKDLLEALPGLTTNLLAKRLQDLVAAGVLEKRELPPPAASVVYALTEKGEALGPAVVALGTWGFEHARHPRKGDTFNFRRSMLVLALRYEPVDRVASIEIRADERQYQIQIGKATAQIVEGQAIDPDLVLSGTTKGLRDLLFRGKSAKACVATGSVSFEGSKSTWQLFLRAFGCAA